MFFHTHLAQRRHHSRTARSLKQNIGAHSKSSMRPNLPTLSLSVGCPSACSEYDAALLSTDPFLLPLVSHALPFSPLPLSRLSPPVLFGTPLPCSRSLSLSLSVFPSSPPSRLCYPNAPAMWMRTREPRRAREHKNMRCVKLSGPVCQIHHAFVGRSRVVLRSRVEGLTCIVFYNCVA